jgi:hypothetical protein
VRSPWFVVALRYANEANGLRSRLRIAEGDGRMTWTASLALDGVPVAESVPTSDWCAAEILAGLVVGGWVARCRW